MKERKTTMGQLDPFYSQRALVLEDDLWMQPIVNSAIKMAIPGVQIDWVESAQDALGMTRLLKYAVILADVNLKPNRETGLDFWYACREECPEIPIVLMSSIPTDVFSKKMGVYGPHYLPKPFHIYQCKEVIRNLVSYTTLTS
jgi:DNA-binding NtrC family response regulator